MTTFSAIAATAWTQCWQLTATILAVAALTLICCRSRPHLAYALWMVVLVKALTPPLWGSTLSALARVPEPTAPEWLAVDAAELPVPDAAATMSEDEAPEARAETSPSQPSPRSTPLVNQTARWPAWAIAWLGGIAAIVAFGLLRLRFSRPLPAVVPADEQLAGLVHTLARRVGVAAPTVLVSEANLGPAVCGVFRPRLLLPRSILAAADIEPIIAHELVHVRRGDHRVVVLQFVVQAAWWFHPLVWWANRRICRLRESCCDAETVAALDAPPQHYARALVDVLEAKIRIRPVFGFPGVRPVEVTAARVKEILAMSDRMLSRTPLSAWLAALVFAAAILPGSSFTPAASDAAAAQTEQPAGPAAEAAPAAPAKPVLVLKYGDGKPDGKKSIAGAGEMIQFEMPAGQTNALKALRIHCARYGYPQPPDEDVEVNVLNEDMTDVVHTELVPYRLFKRQAESRWQMIPFKDPVDVPAKFWVVLNFNAEATKGVYVSYDASTKGEHSRVGFNDQDAKETQFDGDWMVQAILER